MGKRSAGQSTSPERYGLPSLRSPLLLAGLLIGFACASTSPIVKEGLLLEKSGRYDDAISLYERARASGELSEVQAAPRLRESRLAAAEARIPGARSALEAADLTEADQIAREAARLAPDHPPVQRLARDVIDAWIAVAERQEREGQKGDAIRTLVAVRERWPSDERLIGRYQTLVEGEATRLEQLARDYDSRSLPGNALLSLLVLKTFRPQDGTLARDVQARARALWERYRIPTTLEIQARGPDAQALSNELVALRFSSRLLSFRAGPRVPESLHLTLSRLELSVQESSESVAATREVPVGVRRVANADIARAQAEIADFEREILRLGEQIDTLSERIPGMTGATERNNAVAELSRLERLHHARSEEYVARTELLQKLPAEVEQSVTQEVRFPATQYRRLALVTGHLLTQASRPAFSLNVELDLSARAETTSLVHAAFPEHQIQARTLYFERSERELRQAALQALVADVAKTVGLFVNDTLVLERQTGLREVQSGDEERGIERLVRLVMVTDTEIPVEVGTVFAARGLPDAAMIRELVREE